MDKMFVVGRKRSAATTLACCFARPSSCGCAPAFSSAASSSIMQLASMLRDPTLLGKDDDDVGPIASIQQQELLHDDIARFSVFDPGASTTSPILLAKVRSMNQSDTQHAIYNAHEALPHWKHGTSAYYRSQLLSKWSALINEHSEDISTVMTMESGKPLHESRSEIIYGTNYLDFYAGEAIRSNSAGGGVLYPSPFITTTNSKEDVSPSSSPAPRGRCMAINEAVGVCGLITPWNFPLAMLTRKIGPALAAGCTVVLKPSDKTPLTAVALHTLARRAGIPSGVFELITADADMANEVGYEMCVNPLVKKISFTGSTSVGKLLMKNSADTVKRLSLELGGNAPFIVFEDADIDQAVTAAIASKFRNSGQTCVCADRFIIHSSVESEFVTKLMDKVKQIVVGHGMKDEVTMGPLISTFAADTLKQKVDTAITEGATCILGGYPLTESHGPNYFAPTILTNVNTQSSVWATENFGPVVAITTFDTEEEAVSLANDTPTGLASYFFTTNLSRIFRVSSMLENGIVGVNEGVVSAAAAPFGGVKESGLGREGGPWGIHEYLETKYVFVYT